MLILLAVPVIVAVVTAHRCLEAFGPTNVLVRRVRAQAPRWRTTAVLIAVAAGLLVAMHTLGQAVANGAPGWLNLVVLVLAWDAIRMAVLAVTQAVGCVRRLIARQTAGRTGVRRRAVPDDGPSAPRLCA